MRRWRPPASASREANRALAQLPALRRDVAASPGAPFLVVDLRGRRADGVRAGGADSVTLLTVEPGAAAAQVPRPLRSRCISTAQTDFAHLMGFLRGLSDLPVLIVPVDVTVKRDADSLAVKATLHVFNALRPVSSSPCGPVR